MRDDSDALAEYVASLKQGRDCLAGLGFDLDGLLASIGFARQEQILTAVNLLCGTDEHRKVYGVIVDDIRARNRGLFPHPGLFAWEPEESAIGAIYNKLQAARESPDVSALLQSLYDVVDTALSTEGDARANMKDVRKHYDLSNIDFGRFRAEFERSRFKQVLTLNLREKIEERLAMMLAANPTRANLYERDQEIVQEYNKDKDEAEIQRVFDELTACNANLDHEARRYVREELDIEEQLAVFDLLQKDSLNRSERELIKKTAVELLAKLQGIQSQIDHWRE